MTRPVPIPDPTDAATDRDLRELVGYNMKRAFNAVQADLLQTLAPFDLRMITFSALSMIVENPGLRPSQLARGLTVERANLVAIVGELTDRGLVRRSPNPEDGRAQALFATDAGADLYEQARDAVVTHDARMVAALPAEDVARLRRALAQIENAAKGGSP